MANENLQKAVDATKRNKAAVAKYDARRPAVSDKVETKVVDLNPNLIQQGIKKMRTDSAIEKTKTHQEKADKISGIVSSRKLISKPAGGISTKGPSKGSVQKATALKR